jgi:type IV pilus assembly protein PilB
MTAPPSPAPAAVKGLTPPSRRPGPKPRLGDMIVQLGFAEPATIDRGLAYAREHGMPLGQALVAERLVSADDLARALAERNALEHVDLNAFEVDMGAANLIDTAKARGYQAVPIAFVDQRTLLVALADPANVLALDDIRMATGYDMRRAVAAPDDIEALIGQLSQLEQSVQEIEQTAEHAPAEVIELRESADEAPVVKLVHSVIADAVRRGASDIHFQPTSADVRVRFRIDGVVVDSTTVPRHLVSGLVSRVKIMADLDIAERRVPQDGRIGLNVDGRQIDLRVATLPVVRGEAVVMRVLDKGKAMVDLAGLGMHDRDHEVFAQAIRAPDGAVLVTGPTGSGKTTTLYAALTEVNTPQQTLIAIEDPVEYELDGIKQVQVNVKAGLTFASGLRAMVRSDPDVIMVGEVRDRETAQIAIESALTGHLVLTTLHTNDAPLAAARLIEMGIEPFLVAGGIQCVVAQRLVRRLCDCRREVKLSKATLAENGFEVAQGFTACEPEGCVRCGGSGYRGRHGIYEVMVVDEALRALILERASADTLRASAREQGMRSLREDGLEKVRAGITSIAEVLRVTGSLA